jgi:steroid delta-isomerase-like uncharacterized protein
VETPFIEKVRHYVDALNRGDIETLADFYAEDAIVEGPSFKLEGKAAIREQIEKDLAAFTSRSVTYRHQFSSGSHGVIEWVIRAVHTGTVETPFGNVPPSGKCVQLTGVSIMEMRADGRIVRERVYCDDAGFLKQVGALKPF